jgi:hypothetical protein
MRLHRLHRDALPAIPVTTKQGKFWEILESDGLIATNRAKVPGGWLVQQTFIAPLNRDESKLGAMTFVADPYHQWTILAEFK